MTGTILQEHFDEYRFIDEDRLDRLYVLLKMMAKK